MSVLSPEYAAFLARKRPVAHAVGIEPGPMPSTLFDYQAQCVEFGLRQGRAAMFLDTGLGKTRIQLEWCRQAAEASNGRALLLTPLAVARQIEREGVVSVKRGRKFIGCELKPTYWQQAVRALKAAERDSVDLFGAVA